MSGVIEMLVAKVDGQRQKFIEFEQVGV